MSETTIERAGAPEGSPGWITWRDAIEPRSRNSRRRWVCFYAALLVATAAATIWSEGPGDDSYGPPGVALLALAVVFGMLRRSTRGLTSIDHPELDERDEAARNSAFRLAYPLLIAVMLASFVAMAIQLPDGERRRRSDGFTIVDEGSLFTADNVIGMLVWGFLWAVFLPTAVLAWREPDPPAIEWDDPAERVGPPELVRDAFVALVIAGGVALSVFADSGGWAIILLVGGITAVAAWKRSAVGQTAVGTPLQGVGIFVFLTGLLGLGGAVEGDPGVIAGAVALLAFGGTLIYLGRKRG